MSLPDVDVVIPTKDRPDLVSRAVGSVVAQDYPGFIRVIVVADGAPPELQNDSRANRRVCVSRNDRSPSAAAARNAGILAATAPLVAFCDDDDTWTPGKLTAQVAALRAAEDAIGCGTGFVRLSATSGRSERIPRSATIDHAQLLRSRVYEVLMSSLVFDRTRLLEEVGLLDEAIPGSYGEDYDLMLRATRAGPVVAVRQPLVEKLSHSGSFFAQRWDLIIEAIRYLLAKHPDLARDRQGLARLYGRTALAQAALGHRSAAWVWATTALRLSASERNSWVALAMATGLLRPSLVSTLADRRGRDL